MMATLVLIAPPSGTTPLEDQLFYTVSPMTPLDEVLVRFLPQHRTKVDEVISCLVRHLLGIHVGWTVLQISSPPIPDTLVTTTPPRTLLNNLAPHTRSTSSKTPTGIGQTILAHGLCTHLMTSLQATIHPQGPNHKPYESLSQQAQPILWLRALGQLSKTWHGIGGSIKLESYRHGRIQPPWLLALETRMPTKLLSASKFITQPVIQQLGAHQVTPNDVKPSQDRSKIL